MGSLQKPIDFGGVSIIINPVMPKNTYTITCAWPAGRGYPPSPMSCFIQKSLVLDTGTRYIENTGIFIVYDTILYH